MPSSKQRLAPARRKEARKPICRERTVRVPGRRTAGAAQGWPVHQALLESLGYRPASGSPPSTCPTPDGSAPEHRGCHPGKASSSGRGARMPPPLTPWARRALREAPGPCPPTRPSPPGPLSLPQRGARDTQQGVCAVGQPGSEQRARGWSKGGCWRGSPPTAWGRPAAGQCGAIRCELFPSAFALALCDASGEPPAARPAAAPLNTRVQLQGLSIRELRAPRRHAYT